MKIILFFCLCALAFSQSIESQNEELRKTNEVLLKTLRELAVGEEAEVGFGNSKKKDCYDNCRRVKGESQCTMICGYFGADAAESEEMTVGQDEAEVGFGNSKKKDCYDNCRRVKGESQCTMICGYFGADAAESAEMTVGEDEEQVGDDGGCYNRCRATGASMNECASDCPMPGETVVEHDDSTEEEVGRTNPWPCRNTNKVGHNRSMKPGQNCNTDWRHVTYWNARHEYCKNDKGNWGCEFGYKRVGWWNDYCCNKWESLNTNNCKCR